jgi:hypothetical protein
MSVLEFLRGTPTIPPFLFESSRKKDTMENMRLRVCFDEGFSSIEKELKRVWVFIPDTVKIISDLHYLLMKKFSLEKEAKQGVVLYFESDKEYVIPPTQDIGILRESDTIL